MAGLASILWTVAVIIVVLWLLGFIFHIAGSFIHLLLIVAAVIIIFNFITSRRNTI